LKAHEWPSINQNETIRICYAVGVGELYRDLAPRNGYNRDKAKIAFYHHHPKKVSSEFGDKVYDYAFLSMF
jgi:hypothetical protein